MQFSIDQEIGAPLGAVEEALFDPAFVTATSELPRLGDCALLSVERSDGHVRARIHRRFDAPLNRAARKVVDPDRLTWVEEVDYDLAAHRGRHRILPDTYADRIASKYGTRLLEKDDTTRRVTAGSMTVRLPLVGGKVERAIVSGLEEYARAEADLLGRWGRRGER